jgi:MFS transporter, DHA2 family, multidrug resistance protein
MPDVHHILNMATDTGRAMMDLIVTQQAAMIAYLNDYKLLMILTFAMMPLVLIIRAAGRPPTEEDLEEAAVLE